MESDNKLLIRIDERQKAMAETIGKIEKILSGLDEKYATKADLVDLKEESEEKIALVRKIVFTACGVILLAVLYTWLSEIGVNAK